MAIFKFKAIEIKSFKEPGRYSDGGGLVFQVALGGSKSWNFRYCFHGKKRELGLGPYPKVTLLDARKRAQKVRDDIEAGIDPLATRDARKIKITSHQANSESEEPSVYTFEIAARDFIEQRTATWRNANHRAQWTSSLATYALPVIGKLSVSEIQTSHIIAILQPIWNVKRETATRVRGRIQNVIDAATAAGHRSGPNPAHWQGHLDKLLAEQRSPTNQPGNHPAMPYEDLPVFIANLRKCLGITPRALELLILTAARTGELIGMTDAEIDLEKKIWTIAADRMKANKPHSVPLSERAIEIIRSVPREPGNSFLFAGQQERGTHLSNAAMLALMKRIAPKYVPHGFRSSFMDWAHEETEADPKIIDMSLAHTIRDKSERAYRRGSLLRKRQALMAEWEQFLGSKVQQ